MLNNAFKTDNVKGIMTYLEHNAIQSYKYYDGSKTNEKVFVGGTIPLCNKVLALIPDEDVTKTIPPILSDGDEAMNNWKSDIFPIITEKYEIFNNFLIEKKFVKADRSFNRRSFYWRSTV